MNTRVSHELLPDTETAIGGVSFAIHERVTNGMLSGYTVMPLATGHNGSATGPLTALKQQLQRERIEACVGGDALSPRLEMAFTEEMDSTTLLNKIKDAIHVLASDPHMDARTTRKQGWGSEEGTGGANKGWGSSR